MDWFSVVGKYIFHLFIEPRERVHLLSIQSIYIGSWMICRNLYILNNIDKLSCSCPFHTIRDLPCLSGASIFRFILYVHLHWWWSFELKSQRKTIRVFHPISCTFMRVPLAKGFFLPRWDTCFEKYIDMLYSQLLLGTGAFPFSGTFCNVRRLLQLLVSLLLFICVLIIRALHIGMCNVICSNVHVFQ